MKATNTNTNELKLFNNLFEAIKKEILKRDTETLKEIETATDLDKWYFKSLLPKSKKITDFKDIKEAKEYLIKRLNKETDKKINKEYLNLLDIESAPEFNYFNISVEWKRSQTWGANPRAEGYDYNGRYDSGSIGGCGYDKLSTAVANVLNQSKGLKKLLYIYKNNNPEAANSEFLGYGAGYGILPRFEGGVGVNCYPDIFKKIGFNFRQTASGKTFDAFEVTKNN
jgi:hypothetical protein